VRNDVIQQKDERPVAFLLSTAYPELWRLFAARCEHERQYPELDPRLLEPTAELEYA
jgi:hypothetical protein